MRRVRRERPRIPPHEKWYTRVETVPSGRYVEIWFTTAGCRWDASGGCTMCNYGRGSALSPQETVAAVGEALRDTQPLRASELMISPSGSMLDSHEVAPAARAGIYSLVRTTSARRFFVETRAETVTAAAADELCQAVPDKELVLEIGLESADPWVQRFCVNKRAGPEDFRAAMAIAHGRGMRLYANVALGLPFLSARETIADAIASARWALDAGADMVDLFAIHVKPFTLTALLFDHSAYQPPSLWSLVEVLRQLGPTLVPRIELSWYKSYLPAESGLVLSSPSTCPRCVDRVMKSLDDYRATQDWQVVRALSEFDCDCRAAWRRDVEATPVEPLSDRVLRAYAGIGRQLDMSWGPDERSALLAAMKRTPAARPIHT